MTDKAALLAKGQNICLIPNWLMLNNAIRTGNLQILAKVLKQEKHSSPPLKLNAQSFIFGIWSGNPVMLEEVVRIAKLKHGLDFIPNRDALSYAVLGGNPAMVDCILGISRIRKKQIHADFTLLHHAAWSNSQSMVEKVLSFPAGEKLDYELKPIFQLGREKQLDQTVLEMMATAGHPALIDKLLSTAKTYSLPIPKPNKKTLANAIKAGNCALIEKIFQLAEKVGITLRIDADLQMAADWSFNPAMKTYLTNLR